MANKRRRRSLYSGGDAHGSVSNERPVYISLGCEGLRQHVAACKTKPTRVYRHRTAGGLGDHRDSDGAAVPIADPGALQSKQPEMQIEPARPRADAAHLPEHQSRMVVPGLQRSNPWRARRIWNERCARPALARAAL